MNRIKSIYSLESGPLSGLELVSDDHNLLSLRFLMGNTAEEKRLSAFQRGDVEHWLHRMVHEQLAGYFAGTLKTFELPVKLEGTDFQKRVWLEMADIGYGKVATYKEIAARLGSAGKSRAVGQAANRNPIPLIIPCHRVVGASGKMMGFASGVGLKSYLLSHERRDRLW